jgi:hypothetical protein
MVSSVWELERCWGLVENLFQNPVMTLVSSRGNLVLG